MTGGIGSRVAAGLLGLVAVLAVATGCGASTQAPVAKAAVSDAAVNDARYQCLLDHGLPVTRSADGSVKFSDPDDKQGKAYAAASQECEQRLADQGLVQLSSADQLRTEYAALAELHRCLVEHGFPLVAWPSETVYVQRQGAFNVLAASAPIDETKARESCASSYATVDRL